MTTKLTIQFSGWNENGTPIEKQSTILTLEGDVNTEIVIKELEKENLLSPFRGNKDVIIHSMQSL